MREITGLVLNANDQIKTVLVGMVAESHTENSEILIGLIKTTPPEAEDGIQEAIGASEHAIIDITEIPEAAALEIEIEHVVQIDVGGERAVLAHEVAQG